MKHFFEIETNSFVVRYQLRQAPRVVERITGAQRGDKHLVLLPGTLCDDRLWRMQIKFLSPQLPVEIVSPAGHTSVTAYARHILRNINAPRFALAGFSLGGVAALEVWRLAPERISGLALLDTTARGAETWELARHEARERRAAAEQGFVAAYLRRAKTQIVEPAVMRLVERMALEAPPGHGLAQGRAIATRPDSRTILSHIACPTLVLCGKEDRITPPLLTHEIARAIVGADLIEISGVGHMSLLEAPDRVNAALLDWLHKA